MLNEVYTPKTVADLAWSRQKSVALSSFIRSIRNGLHGASVTHTPRILLLYGPPGCAKLESLKLLLQEEVHTVSTSTVRKAPSASSSSAAAPYAAADIPTSINTFHTCDATVSAYAQYLQHVISLCSGQLVGSALELTSPMASEPREVVGLSGAAAHRRNSSAPPSSAAPVHHSHIIKFYGEPASHPLHRCTHFFLRQYEELLAQAVREDQQLRQLSGTPQKSSMPLEHLRHNLIFFIHTTHDSHNDKLDLGISFPPAVLQSSAVELFHCTPITEINLKKRLKQILDYEARRRWEVSRPRPTATAALEGPSRTARNSHGRGAMKGRGRTLRAKSALPSEGAPPFNDVLDEPALDAIAAGSQGDIRQALLQVQWAALLHPKTAEAGPSTASGEADGIWARLQKRRALACALSGTDGHVGAASLPQSPNNFMDDEDAGNVKGHASCEDCEVKRDGAVSIDDEVILISSSSSSSTSARAPSPSAGLTTEPIAAQGGSPARNPPPTARKRARSPQAATTSASSAPHVADMLSLLDSQMDEAHLSAAAMPIAPPCKEKRKESQRTIARHRSSTPIDAKSSDASPKLEHRSVFPTTRDEYLGLSHATGRLLTQKYSIDEVLDILNVSPRKVLDYLTNNQIRYFSDSQLPQYVACAAAASEADALRTSEFGGSYTGVASAAALRERRQLAERTTAGESVGNTARLLDVIALQVFHHTYLAKQTELHAPLGFAAQEPPPFLRSAYPRIRDVAGLFSCALSTSGSPSSAHGDWALPLDMGGFSEQEWTQRFLMRLDSGSAFGFAASSSAFNSRRRGRSTSSRSSGGIGAASASSPRLQIDEVDILREGLPDLLHRCGCTESAVLDCYALAPYIVLNTPPPASFATSLNSSTCASPPAHLATPTKAHNQKGDARVNFTVKQEPSPPFFKASATLNCGAPSFTGPRRTVFKFAALAEPSNSACVHSAATTSPPNPLHGDRRSLCTLLQLKILQRGRDSATATLRKDRFTLVDMESTATAGAMGEEEGVEDRLWIPEGEDIEDD
ncbi:hypothetical protein ABL78_0452 [Leptomonas seymouri]|uniref:Uncharacterized protein n=1 Tax=Leptomonas seymouri TaxID=5684 RepID=A0A0N0P8V0_LEPSE|nr:hypothetical protein ABL78_0452 [Leptomonas seymouri]|eukprot:KPI90376.1 hypothetical protein ABL78_0452 [Leptomonas seymouri]